MNTMARSMTMGAKASWTAAALCRFPSPALPKAFNLTESARGLAHSKTWRTVVAALLLVCISRSIAGERDPDHDYDAPAPGTYTLPVIKPAADGALLDATGK